MWIGLWACVGCLNTLTWSTPLWPQQFHSAVDFTTLLFVVTSPYPLCIISNVLYLDVPRIWTLSPVLYSRWPGGVIKSSRGPIIRDWGWMALPCRIWHLTVAEGSQDSCYDPVTLCMESDNFGSTWNDNLSGYAPIVVRVVEHKWTPVSKHTGTSVVTCYEACNVRSKPVKNAIYSRNFAYYCVHIF